MRDELNRRALENDRKANAEIVSRLRASLNPMETPEYQAIRELFRGEFQAMHDKIDHLTKEVARLSEKL